METIVQGVQLDHVAAPDDVNFEALVRENDAQIFRFLFSSLRDRDIAETLTQECFSKAYRGMHGFRGNANPKTWLMAIAVDLLRNHYRSRRLFFWKQIRAVTVQPIDISDWVPDHSKTAEETFILRAQVLRIFEAVRRLPEAQRTIFLLRYVEGFSMQEIEISTGIGSNSLKVQLYRALQAVRRQVLE